MVVGLLSMVVLLLEAVVVFVAEVGSEEAVGRFLIMQANKREAGVFSRLMAVVAF